MRIDSDGNVGVAVTDPNARLEVKTRDSDELAIRVMSENENSLLDIRKSDNGDTEFLNTYYSASEGGLSGGFAFKTTDNASGATKRTRMSILQNGNVGIGTDSPSAPLEVASTTGGVIMPRMNNSQRNAISSPTDGEMIFNNETNKLNVYNGTAWRELTDTAV
jgi:hypothetical protein